MINDTIPVMRDIPTRNIATFARIHAISYYIYLMRRSAAPERRAPDQDR